MRLEGVHDDDGDDDGGNDDDGGARRDVDDAARDGGTVETSRDDVSGGGTASYAAPTGRVPGLRGAFIIASTPCSCVGCGDQHSGIVRLFEVV